MDDEIKLNNYYYTKYEDIIYIVNKYNSYEYIGYMNGYKQIKISKNNLDFPFVNIEYGIKNLSYFMPCFYRNKNKTIYYEIIYLNQETGIMQVKARDIDTNIISFKTLDIFDLSGFEYYDFGYSPYEMFL